MPWFRRFQTSFLSSPAIGPAGLYIGGMDGKIYCLDLTSGASIWTIQTDSAVVSSPIISIDNTVYVSSTGGTVYALNGLTGSGLWNYSYTSSSIKSSGALGADGTLYIASDKVYAIPSSPVPPLGKVTWPMFGCVPAHGALSPYAGPLSISALARYPITNGGSPAVGIFRSRVEYLCHRRCRSHWASLDVSDRGTSQGNPSSHLGRSSLCRLV